MTVAEFDEVVNRRLDLIRRVLLEKGKEYARGGDRLSNFKNGGKAQRVTPEQALLGYMTKQFVSIVDFIQEDLPKGVVHTQAEWDEKLGDCINYLCLLEAVTVERRTSG
jgi:hypothetical protein